MLSVCRAASEAAASLLEAEPTVRSRDVLTTAPPRPARPWPGPRSSCRRSVTPGVVDAGGRGVVVILDAAETALTGRRPPPVEAGTGSRGRTSISRAWPSPAPTWWTMGRRTR